MTRHVGSAAVEDCPPNAGVPSPRDRVAATVVDAENDEQVFIADVDEDQPDRPRKKDDHTIDCVRYLAMGMRLAV